jgi:hypothetical protein
MPTATKRAPLFQVATGVPFGWGEDPYRTPVALSAVELPGSFANDPRGTDP